MSALQMHSHATKPTARRPRGLARALAPLGLAALLAVPAASTPAMQDGKSARPDTVTALNRRGTTVSSVSGVVTQNGLDDVLVTVAGKEEKIESERVLAIEFGDVPTSYRDGTLFSERGEHASAAASFKLAAGNGDARDVVRAAARLRAAEALLAWGAAEPAHFTEAADEAQTFLTDYPENRDLPRAQLTLARARLLAGNHAEAAAAYRAVYEKLNGEEAAEGYKRADCFAAGLSAANALLDAGDTLAARQLHNALVSALGPLIASLEEDSGERRALQNVLDAASLGEGFSELAAGNSGPALTFFTNQQRGLGDSSSDALRYGTLLGLGESLLAEGRTREAQMTLAKVSALTHSDRDQVSRALLRMAEAGAALGDPRDSQRILLETVVQQHGDTPAASKAREMLKTL